MYDASLSGYEFAMVILLRRRSSLCGSTTSGGAFGRLRAEQRGCRRGNVRLILFETLRLFGLLLPLEAELDPSFPEVPLPLLDESRWHPLWSAPFVHAEPIHLKEARAALAAIKHRTRDATRHGGREVLFGDNMAVILAFSKGRATSHP